MKKYPKKNMIDSDAQLYSTDSETSSSDKFDLITNLVEPTKRVTQESKVTNQRKRKNDTSEEETSDSCKTKSHDRSSEKPTETRIEFVKNILKGSKLKPMIDFDNVDSSTNIKLNKQIMNIKELFTSMDIRLRYLKSGTTGHTFKGVSKGDKSIEFAVKVCAYPKDEYGAINNLSRPENTELRMLKLLSQFVIKRCTPHFVLPIGMFNTNITNFIKIPPGIIDLKDPKNKMYKKFVARYHNDDYEDFVSVLISEWANGGDLLDYIRKNYAKLTLKDWVVFIFQILFTLSLIHKKYPAFRHNDMKANNILVQLTNITSSMPYYCYNMDGVKFIMPNINMQIKIWDFDFACIDGIIENNKVNASWTRKMNITKKENKYYDMHYFFNTLISARFFPQFYEGGVPPEIVEFVHRIIPEKYRTAGKYVNEKGRIQVDFEYTTPYKVIMTDPLFNKYRYTGGTATPRGPYSQTPVADSGKKK
uniref:Protein kinase domain-containing protein n=1 Tax=viral metagenome TaxID=1070528 RepID=A0A6C0C933_9ZZZZ